MDNEPNKNAPKGKTIVKKTSRRNSRSSNSQNSIVSRSKSIDIQPPDANYTDATGSAVDGSASEKKNVNIEENLNQIYEDTAQENKGAVIRARKSDTIEDKPTDLKNSKKTVKRKLEEDSAAGTSAGASDTDADDRDPSKDKKKKNRCAVCRKKVGLTGFECRCGGLFCAVHRYSDKHDCSFNYRELGAQEIRRNNPVVVSQKIHKI